VLGDECGDLRWLTVTLFSILLAWCACAFALDPSSLDISQYAHTSFVPTSFPSKFALTKAEELFTPLRRGGNMLAERHTIATLIILLLAFAIPVQPLAQQQENETSLLSSTAPIPLIYQPLVPDAIRPGATGFTLTVNGTGFLSGSVVKWNGSSRTTTFVNNSRLTASIPASDVAKAGTASVMVVNPSPSGGTSNTVFFEVTKTTTYAALTTPSFVVEAEPASVAAGDFNGDGKLDLAVGNNTDISVVSIFLGNGDGTFQSAVDYGSGSGFNSVAIGDFNRDGKLDIAVADSGRNNVSILLGKGDGTFQPMVDYAAGSGPSSVAVADLNRDGKLDLVVANNGSNNVSILLGNGDGTFRPAVNHSVGLGPSSVAVADLNRDGKLDLVVANNGSHNVSILLGNGDGTFRAPVEYGVGTTPNSVTVADFNRDGKLDLAVVNNGSSNVSILLGNGDGTFPPARDFTVSSDPHSVVVADFNGDGRLDLAVASGDCCSTTLNGPGKVSFLLGNGDGTFQPPLAFVSAQSAGAATIGDFNRDGRLDLAVTDAANGGVAILLQRPVVSGPNATLSTTRLLFECRNVVNGGCQCITSGTVTLSNFGDQTLNITGIMAGGPFLQSNNCGTSLKPGRSCTINVTWLEKQGSGEGLLSFTDNAPGSPQEVSLFGEKLCNPLASRTDSAASHFCSPIANIH
jgi:hypothetical protein